MKNFRYTYFAYGFTIGSYYPMFGFEEICSIHPDIVIESGTTPGRLKNVRNQSRFYQSNDEEFLLRINGIATYYVTRGTNVIVQRMNNADDGEVSAYLSGMIMGVIFHQRGLIPLHASSVVYNGKCLVFAGDTGAGKSTLAALLINSGANLVADDITLIGFKKKLPVVYPAYPCLKVWRRNLNLMGIDISKLHKVPLEKEKYYLPITEFETKETSIDYVFFIESDNVGFTDARSLVGIQKFIKFEKSIYLGNYMYNNDYEGAFFKKLNMLIMSLPASVLSKSESEINYDKLLITVMKLIE